MEPPLSDVTETVPVSRSTSGTDCWPTILTTTVPASSWTGSSSPPAVSAGQLVTFFYSLYFYFIWDLRCSNNPFLGKWKFRLIYRKIISSCNSIWNWNKINILNIWRDQAPTTTYEMKAIFDVISSYCFLNATSPHNSHNTLTPFVWTPTVMLSNIQRTLVKNKK